MGVANQGCIEARTLSDDYDQDITYRPVGREDLTGLELDINICTLSHPTNTFQNNFEIHEYVCMYTWTQLFMYL